MFIMITYLFIWTELRKASDYSNPNLRYFLISQTQSLDMITLWFIILVAKSYQKLDELTFSENNHLNCNK